MDLRRGFPEATFAQIRSGASHLPRLGLSWPAFSSWRIRCDLVRAVLCQWCLGFLFAGDAAIKARCLAPSPPGWVLGREGLDLV